MINVTTHGGTVHATRGTYLAYGRSWPRPLCGAGRTVTVLLAETTEPTSCKRCLSKLAKLETN